MVLLFVQAPTESGCYGVAVDAPNLPQKPKHALD